MPITAPYHQYFTELRKRLPNMPLEQFYSFSYSTFRKMVEGEGDVHPEAGATFIDLFPQHGEALLMTGSCQQEVPHAA